MWAINDIGKAFKQIKWLREEFYCLKQNLENCCEDGGNTETPSTIYINSSLATETIGGFLQGQAITPPEGLNDTEFKDKLFNSVISPTISFNVTNVTLEKGSSYSKEVVITETQNDAGALIETYLEKDGVQNSLTILETNLQSSFTLQAFASYSASQELNAIVISTALRTVNVKYKYFTYSGILNSSPTESGVIRALNSDFISTNEFNIVIPQGDVEVTIYIPQENNLVSVLYQESSNANITNGFSETIVTVNDANNNSVNYKKLTQTIGGTGYTANATYKITLS